MLCRTGSGEKPLLDVVSQNSFPTHREDWYSIGLEDFEPREEMLDLRGRLNEMRTFAYRAHQDLVRMGRKPLG
jgi:hypothetical protein